MPKQENEYPSWLNNPKLAIHPMLSKGFDTLTGLFDMNQMRQAFEGQWVDGTLHLIGEFPRWKNPKVELRFAEFDGKGFCVRVYIYGETSRRKVLLKSWFKEQLGPYEVSPQQPEGMYYLLDGECKLAPRFHLSEAKPLLKYRGSPLALYPELYGEKRERTLYQFRDMLVEANETSFPTYVDEFNQGYGYIRTISKWELENEFIYLLPESPDRNGPYADEIWFSTLNRAALKYIEPFEVLDERVLNDPAIPGAGRKIYDKQWKRYLIIVPKPTYTSTLEKDCWVEEERHAQSYLSSAQSIYLNERFDVLEMQQSVSGYAVDKKRLRFFELTEKRAQGYMVKPLFGRRHTSDDFLEADNAVNISLDIPACFEAGRKKVEQSYIAHVCYVFLRSEFFLDGDAYAWIGMASDRQLALVVSNFFERRRELAKKKQDDARKYVIQDMLQWLPS